MSQPDKPFHGEMMTCLICGDSEQHQADDAQCIVSERCEKTDWRCLEVDGDLYYFCPREFPPDGAKSDCFKTAYQRCVVFIMQQRTPINQPENLERLEIMRRWNVRELAAEWERDAAELITVEIHV